MTPEIKAAIERAIKAFEMLADTQPEELDLATGIAKLDAAELRKILEGKE